MAGFIPAIHVFEAATQVDVDARHDDAEPFRTRGNFRIGILFPHILVIGHAVARVDTAIGL